MSDWLTDDGYAAPRAADFLTRVRDAYEDATGLAIDWSADTFLGTISTIAADLLGEVSEATQALYDAFDLGNASGLQLDNLCLIVGVIRTEATYSTATVTLAGTPGTIVVQGSLVQGGGSDDRQRWETTADATIGLGGTIAVVVQATDAGLIVATAGAIDQIVTPLSGWTTCTNADPATAGANRETDAALRKRRQSSLQNPGSRSLNAIRANLLEVSGVQAAVVLDNDGGAAAVVEGVLLAAHSIGVILYPSTLTDAQKQAAALAIYNNVAAGIATNGTDVVATVTGADGYAKTIRYDFATTLTVNVATVVALAVGFDLDDVGDAVIAAIADYMLALSVGDAVRLLPILGLLSEIDGIEGATVTLNGGSVDIEPAATVLAIIGTNTVTA